ncbi:hypothetical protein V5O48_009296 [Marasmius crinis-equi]|uniref:Uncharacterized protein n=1 Tax=Marasmius crinis-equi TaxID=585013 RepID=A0ABR3FC50_9AGAR
MLATRRHFSSEEECRVARAAMADPSVSSPGYGYLSNTAYQSVMSIPYFLDAIAKPHYPPYPDGTDFDKQRHKEEKLLLEAVVFAGDRYIQRHFSTDTNNCCIVTGRFLLYLIAHDEHTWIIPTNWERLWNPKIYKEMEKEARKARFLRPFGKMRDSIGWDFAPWYNRSGQPKVYVRGPWSPFRRREVEPLRETTE